MYAPGHMFGRVRDFLMGRTAPRAELLSRHERREAARVRHQTDGSQPWTDADRHLGGPGQREVEDITPGTAGYPGGKRLTRR